MPLRCLVCGEERPDGSRFCPACGAPAIAASELPTETDDGLATPAQRVGRLRPSSSHGLAGYPPGAVLAGRFRIVGLLGLGGMGEVYRADDLTLGQPVALKCLPPELSRDLGRRERFYSEVRLARQIAHPNVCRVYDINEVDGQHFLSMEYIDGEDLASLLKRIGRLPASKVLEIAQQLSAGLAAAHGRGVLHRDLKPANVMIDSLGGVRITDFGLAIAVDQVVDEGRVLGTPAYMAPEQLNGEGGAVQSDLYALGLVLYELCAGKRTFTARTIDDLRGDKNAWVPTHPSEFVRDLDPAVERVILWCLQRDPRLRPVSALQVAMALPGRDPLAEAIAAGETPSPEVVAASASHERMQPGTAGVLLAALALATAAAVGLGGRAVMPRRTPLDRPPEALVERARQVLEHAGYVAPPRDTAFGVEFNQAYLRYRHQHDASPRRWDSVSPNAVTFWYRQSPRPLKRLTFTIGLSAQVTPADPPLAVPGEALVLLNGQGRLMELMIVPAGGDRAPPASEFDWGTLLTDAAVGEGASPADPSEPPRLASDRRLGWRPSATDASEPPSRVEAASFAGAPVDFRVIYPWNARGESEAQAASPSARAANFIGIAFTAVAMVGGFLLARRNLRLGRGDRRGASRLMTFVVVVLAIAWVLDEHHVADAHEWYLLISFAGRALLIVGLFGGMYLAFEPYVRRHWPSTIVSWSRLLAGGVRDPLVGRDVVIGCVAGAALTSLLLLHDLLPSWLGLPGERLATPTWRAWLGPAMALSLTLQLVCNAILEAFTALFLLVLLRTAVGRELLAASLCAVLLAVPDILLSDNKGLAAVFFVAIYFLALLLLMRVGLVAVITLRFCIDVLQVFPIVPRLSPWYAGLGFGALVLIGVLAGLGIHAALRGRRHESYRLA
jgi:serine/threonine-protein kinase